MAGPDLSSLLPVGTYMERAALRTPDKAAVIHDGAVLSYAALDAAANRLAHRVLESGIKGDRVTLLMPDGPSVFVAIVAALKAGRIAHVLNHRDPPSRLADLVADSEPEAILTAAPHVDLATRLAGGRARVIRVDTPDDGVPGTSPRVAIEPGDGAYLVYTSGSAGRPKAVLLAHGDLVRTGLGLGAMMSFVPADRVALLSSLWGAQALGTTMATLLAGATLLPFPVVDYGIVGLEAWLREEAISVYVSAASLFRAFLAALAAGATFPAIRIVKASADPATSEDFAAFRRHFPNAGLFSSMGASEVGSIAGILLDRDSPVAAGRLPVGRAAPGLSLHIVDGSGREVPVGETGTLVIRSPALFGRYWRDEALTAARYASLPDGSREFRSEDAACLDGDGNLVHAGRRDATYKIRGQRVDLAEVERILAALPGIEDAAATVVERAGGDGRIVGHVVVRGDASPRRLRALARAHMPRHMVPSAFVAAAALPRTANGKLDRASLRLATPPSTDPSEPPVTATERQLASFWEDALDIDGVGRDDDFFDLGGDSLSAATVAIRVDEARGLRLSFDAFVETPVLKDMAAAIDRAGTGVDRERLAPVPRGAEAPTSLLQEPFWRFSRAPAHAWRYTRAAAISLDGPLDRDALGAALDAVIARHEILRTRYRAEADAVIQIVEPAAPVPLPLVDLEGLPDTEAELDRRLAVEGRRTLDLAAGPPLAFVLLRLAPERHVLLRTGHHILDDAPSWNLFLRDLGAFYAAVRGGSAVDLPALPIQYADFSIWQRRVWRAGGPRHDEALAWLAAKFGTAPRPPALRTLPGYLRRGPLGDTKPRAGRTWGFDGATAAALARLSEEESATFYVLRLACLAPVVSAFTGHEAVVVGGVFTNRNNAAVEHLIGPLANLVPLVVRCDPRATFREHVRAVKAEVMEAHRHADLPLAELLRALAETGIEMPSPFLWIHVPTPSPPVTAAGLVIRQRNAPYLGASGVVMVRFNPLAEEAGSTVSIDPRIYAPELLDDLAHALRTYARIAAASPEATLADIAARAAGEPREG